MTEVSEAARDRVGPIVSRSRRRKRRNGSERNRERQLELLEEKKLQEERDELRKRYESQRGGGMHALPGQGNN